MSSRNADLLVCNLAPLTHHEDDSDDSFSFLTFSFEFATSPQAAEASLSLLSRVVTHQVVLVISMNHGGDSAGLGSRFSVINSTTELIKRKPTNKKGKMKEGRKKNMASSSAICGPNLSSGGLYMNLTAHRE